MHITTPSSIQNRMPPQELRSSRCPTPGSCSPNSSNHSTWGSQPWKFMKVHLSDDSGMKVCFPRPKAPTPSAYSLKHSKSLSMDADSFVPSRDHLHVKNASLDDSVSMPPEMTGPYNHRNQKLPPDHPNASFPHFHSVPENFERNSSHQIFPRHFSLPSNTAQFTMQVETNGGLNQALYDPYVTPPSSMATPAQTPQINPYTQEPNPAGNTSYYQNSSFAQPIQYHLYTSLGPHREALLAYQRAAHDFFIPDGLREDLQRKSATTIQTLPST